MPANLDTLIAFLRADPGLSDGVSASQMQGGIAAARAMDQVLLAAIEETRANRDGLLTPGEMATIAAEVFDNPAAWQKFIIGHGNDNDGRETGFHLLQGDGGSLEFQGRNFVDTVADSIYHYGFDVIDGRYVNEDGASNETTADVAGWLNYFLNGVNVVFGAGGDDEVGSGEYSDQFASARNETFLVYGGNDRVWADRGNDTVWCGTGDDLVGGGDGKDKLYGEVGRDTLFGEAADDRVYGGDGRDSLGGGDGADQLFGGTFQDQLAGNDGNDQMSGGAGSDVMYGGAGRDSFRGGAGADDFFLYEERAVADKLFFYAGDSGRTAATIDTVEGFDSGTDKINLASFGPMTFEDLEYRGGGDASCYYDGNYLRIDTDGDGATNMIVEFKWTEDLRAGDFIFD